MRIQILCITGICVINVVAKYMYNEAIIIVSEAIKK